MSLRPLFSYTGDRSTIYSLFHSLDSFLVGLSNVLRLSSIINMAFLFKSKILPMTRSFYCPLTRSLCSITGKGSVRVCG